MWLLRRANSCHHGFFPQRFFLLYWFLKPRYFCTRSKPRILHCSPIVGIAEYHQVDYYDGSKVVACHTLANTFWSALYFLSSIFLFFIAPLVILLVLYCIIAKNLISHAAALVLNKHIDSYSVRARRQVILMLGTVVLSFFVCLIPFRVFTLWIIIVPEENVYKLGVERYYNILYFCRIMVYLNSAINPILYNLMSSKFRSGFMLCSKTRRKLRFGRSRNGTLSTTANSCRSSTVRNSHEGFRVSYRARNNSVLLKYCDSIESSRSNESPKLKSRNEIERVDAVPARYTADNGRARHFSVVSENVVIFDTDKHGNRSLQNVFGAIERYPVRESFDMSGSFVKQNKRADEESLVWLVIGICCAYNYCVSIRRNRVPIMFIRKVNKFWANNGFKIVSIFVFEIMCCKFQKICPKISRLRHETIRWWQLTAIPCNLQHYMLLPRFYKFQALCR